MPGTVHIPGMGQPLPLWLAVSGAIAGIVWLFLGWKAFRPTLVIFAFAAGGFLGALVADWAGLEKGWGVVGGGSLLALLAQPLWRVLVFLQCGLAGGILAGETLAFFGHDLFPWGLAAGFVISGVLSQMFMRHIVIGATSVLGAGTLSVCLLELLDRLVIGGIRSYPYRHRPLWLLCQALMVLVGFLFQLRYSSHRQETENLH
ncbi:MAG: TMEM198/TM7SF3 family protein [Deltaproteobacteria bacterium]|nr:MAG: TMEM198/TM7SF3 family protein [Deltaproteobacteria bacterium]